MTDSVECEFVNPSIGWAWFDLCEFSLVVTVTRGTTIAVPLPEGGMVVVFCEVGEGVGVLERGNKIGESVPELSLSVRPVLEFPLRDSCQTGCLPCLGLVAGLFSTLLLLFFFSDLILAKSSS